MDVETVSRLLNAFLSDSPPTDSSLAELSLGDAFKLAAEDLKAFYAEAATARPDSMVSAEQYGDWFWDETAAGTLLKTLREACAEHPDPLVKAFARGTLAPAARVQRQQSQLE